LRKKSCCPAPHGPHFRSHISLPLRGITGEQYPTTFRDGCKPTL